MKKNCVLLFVALLSFHLNGLSQSREYIRNQIEYQGSCRNVAITKTNGDLMLYGQNGWASSGCPKGLTDALSELNGKGEFIDDVQLTESGRWLILYGNNGIRWNDIPYSLEQQLREFNKDKEIITSVSFNDAGNWIVVTTDYYCASDARVSQWLEEGNKKYGKIWATCITDDAIVVVYANGYQFLGDIPSTLQERLRSTRMDVFRLKIAGESWFFSDGENEYDYRM